MSHKLKHRPRVRVIWWGHPSPSAVSSGLRSRGLSVEDLPIDGELPADLSSVLAVVLCDTDEKPRFSENLRKTDRHIDHGVGFFAHPTEASFARFQNAIRDWSQRLGRRTEDAPIRLMLGDTDRFVHEIAIHQSGAGANASLSIAGDFLPDDEVLIRRAFSDCAAIRLQPVTGGRSAKTYLVHATLARSATGTRPQPFFVKTDARHKIERELANYDDCVLGFIPFVNRPNLADGRCLSGLNRGILVGTFVDRSERFIDIAVRGDAPIVLNSLFDDALRGWREQAFETPAHRQFAESPVRPVMTAIDEAYRGAVDLERIPAGRIGLAMRLGLTRSPAKILEGLRALPAARFRQGPVHGDLHVDNVCAYRGSAILIDFFSARNAPLACDPAALEVSLLMHQAAWNGSRDDRKPPFAQVQKEWTDVALGLFAPEHLVSPPPPASAHASREWLWNCVRHIRMHALSAACTADEYRTALAVFLLRAAGYSPAAKAAESHRRATALVLADRVASQVGAV